MFFKDTKNMCDLYNNLSYKNFIIALYSNPDYRNLNKCKYCGNEIYYTNIKFKDPRHKYPVFSKGTTLLSYKTINGIKYNICVEFNGEAFHPNPKKYKPTDLFRTPYNPKLKPVKERFIKETYQYNDLYKNFNIKTIVVYESDYKKIKTYV